MVRSIPSALLFTALSLSSTAGAHLTLASPSPRHPESDLKYGPCGVGPLDERSTDPGKITTYTAGQTITVTWTEVVDHDPSHYRIAFSPSGDSFEDPTGYDDIRADYPILLDGIPDADAGKGHVYSVEVTLPNEPCDECSLQVIQVMHDKPPWGPGGGDDIYYQCADIVIVEADAVIDPPGGAGSTGVDSTAGSGGSITTDPMAPNAELGSGGTEAITDDDTETTPSGAKSSDTGGCSLGHQPGKPGLPLLLVGLIAGGLCLGRRQKSARLD